jgi:Protein of unknown function (DUF1360)
MRSYDPEGEVDLHGFAGSLAAYAVTTAGFAALTRFSGRQLPAAYPTRDLVVGGLAAHKFSRLIARGSVTSPLRAPFTEFEGPAGSSEHQESARGDHGFRHTVGELLTCPFCMDVWVGTAYVGALQVAPRAARAWAAIFAVTAVSDFLQHAYARLRG